MAVENRQAQAVPAQERMRFGLCLVFVGGFLGSPPMNFIPVTLENGKVRFNETDIALSSEQIAALNGEKDFIIGIRLKKRIFWITTVNLSQMWKFRKCSAVKKSFISL